MYICRLATSRLPNIFGSDTISRVFLGGEVVLDLYLGRGGGCLFIIKRS